MYYNQDTILFFDGTFIKAADAGTDMYGQSLHYGFGAFEGIRSYQTQNGTRIFKALEHFGRLQYSAEAVGIPYTWDNEALIAITYELLQRNGFGDAYIRPLIFCPPNMSLQRATTSTLCIAAWEWGAYLGEKLLRVRLSSFERPNPKGFKVEAKITGHYVNSILACQEAKDTGYDEALLTDMHGYVAEGPGANMFMEKDGALFTPSPGNILPGITRATVIELARELRIPVTERQIAVDELRAADAAFFCGTAAEIIGWESFDGAAFPVDWKYSLGKKIQDAYKDRVLEKTISEEKSIA